MFIILFIRVFFTSVNKGMSHSLYKHIPNVSFHYVRNNNLHYLEEEDKKQQHNFIRNGNSDDNFFFEFSSTLFPMHCTHTTWNIQKKKKQNGNNDSVWERH